MRSMKLPETSKVLRQKSVSNCVGSLSIVWRNTLRSLLKTMTRRKRNEYRLYLFYTGSIDEMKLRTYH